MNAKRWRLIAAAAVMAVLAYALLLMPTPYIVYKPGLAEDVGPMVKAKHPDVSEDSVFMLTTVRQLYPNWLLYAAARFNDNWDIYRKKDIFREGESRSDYLERQQFVMKSSQSNALRAAYELAGIPYELAYEGVVVLRVIPDMPAAGVLQPGDRIVAVDGEKVERSEEVLQKLGAKQVGDAVAIRYVRGSKKQETEIRMGDFSKLPGQQADAPQPGLGIQPADLISVQAEDPDKQVEIRVEDIGGPSAGLMFALEIYDQLTPGDLSRGLRIAGTGEIYPDGRVASIGGVRHKVQAAEREKAELFFVPQANYNDAKKQADRINSSMKVVPVESMKDALDYLESLDR